MEALVFKMIGNVGFEIERKEKRKMSLAEECFNDILTGENSRTYFCSKLDGKYEVTNESVKTVVLNKLYNIVSSKIAKMDVGFKEILNTKGQYTKYRYFKSIDDTIKEIKNMIAEKELGNESILLNTVFAAHQKLCENIHLFMDAFRFDVGAVKQYYLSVVSSIIYSLSYIITSIINYTTRDGKIDYKLIYKNMDIQEKGLPKNMLGILSQFNDDCDNGNIKTTINMYKNTKPEAAKESLRLYGDEVTDESPLILTAAIIGGIIMIPSLIRYVIYFFMHSKIKISEYFEQQALFLELNVRRLKNSGTADKKVIADQEKIIERMRSFAVKLSGDKYRAEREVEREISKEDKDVVKEADTEAKTSKTYGDNTDTDINDSDILL